MTMKPVNTKQTIGRLRLTFVTSVSVLRNPNHDSFTLSAINSDHNMTVQIERQLQLVQMDTDLYSHNLAAFHTTDAAITDYHTSLKPR